MKYIIMCGGEYKRWEMPRQLLKLHGEEIVARTIRFLRDAGVEDIAISSNSPEFGRFGVPVLEHDNSYVANGYCDVKGYWSDAFYPTDEPVCYLFGDVVFSVRAIKTIVETETNDIEFFASAAPFAIGYPKPWAEPFALKVVDQEHLHWAIEETKRLDAEGKFNRSPIMWELWQVIKGTQLNRICTNYTVINDYTCDVDNADEIPRIEQAVMRYGGWA